MITDIIDLSSDDESQNDSASSLPAVNNVERNSDDDSNTEPSPTTSGKNTSPVGKKRKGRLKKTGNSYNGVTRKDKEDRQKLKKKVAEEKQARKNANKIYKPGECMKYMTIEMHPTLLNSWFCADLQREANASGVKVKSIPNICDPALVLWTRTVIPTLENNDGFVQLTSKVKCDRSLYILTTDNVEELVSSHCLSKHMKQVAQLVECKLSLVLYGIKDYFKTSGCKAARNQRLMSEIDLEKAITDLLVSADCDTIIVNTPNELALTIVQFTKAIAEQPYKKTKQALDEQADFYMRGDNKKCVAVDKDGHGLGRLWQQMLAILPHSSLEISRAICAKYKSPLELYESLRTDGHVELGSLPVSRAALPGAKTRKIGVEYSRRIHALFCEDDGDVLLD